MASASGGLPAATASTVTTITEEQRRWVVIGICLNKLLTPVLKTVLKNEITAWYNKLCLSPSNINKQTYKKYAALLPPSKIKLNYANINNNNTIHKTKSSAYDYAVKDPESLAKLFVQPFMAKFTGFDQTMDLSAALSVMCEANPFYTTGASAQARKIRSDVRNQWAHCNFSHWSDANYRTCVREMELLVRALKLSNADENELVNKLNSWRDKGVQLCCGQAVDPVLLELVKSETDELSDSLRCFLEESKDAESRLKKTLQSVQQSFRKEILKLREVQTEIGQDINNLKESLSVKYEKTSEQLETLENKVAKLSIGNEEVGYLFMIPDRIEWFSGREFELHKLRSLLPINREISEQKVPMVSVSGLGGTGKTSLVAEYAHRWKDHYNGGAFWFSGEDEATFAKSVDEHAVSFGTLDATPGRTLVKTLEVISKIQKSWLLVLDDMDEYKISSSIKMLLSGPWKQRVVGSGHILITTRREPRVITQTIRGFKEPQCLQLDSFNVDDGKEFVFKRTDLTSNQETSAEAANLVETLGGLPLALEQACAYISHVSCSLSMYLEQYKKYSLELLNEQEANPVSIHESSERLAVRTTWLLNFDYIKRSPHGNAAVRFLHACAFFSPNEIQKELVNPGKPPIKDTIYRDYVSTPLGPSHILKLLSDFSLFQKNKDSSLSVHRLVRDVIRKKLQSENQNVLSLVDAVSMLCLAFSECPSPDDFVANDINQVDKRASTQACDPSLFYFWQKMCLHAQEVLTVLYSCDVLDERVLTPETARIVYECALHLNVSSKPVEAKHAFNFAHKIISLIGIPNSKLQSLFPHEVPLSESVRRYIFYSCSANFRELNSSGSDKSRNMELQPKSEKMYSQGSAYFNEGNFYRAVELYSYAMAITSSFNPKLLCDRALTYIKLKQYKNALKDSEDYLLRRPKCWMGLAIKALSLHGLNEIWEASSFAALAFYCNDNIFRDYEPFKSTFSFLENQIFICNNSSALLDLLLKPISDFQDISDSPGRVIMIEPGNYLMNIEWNTIFSPFFARYATENGLSNIGLIIDNCILLGVDNTRSSVVIRFHDLPGLLDLTDYGLGITSGRRVMAANISFVFSKGKWQSNPDSISSVLNCSFTSSSNQLNETFLSSGTDEFRDCCFENCPGLSVIGIAKVERCVFSGSKYPSIDVARDGRLEMKESKIHGNEYGIYIRDQTVECSITNCSIFDNRYHGIYVTEGASNIKVKKCRIYHNDGNGLYIADDSSALISYCEIFENGWNGISTLSDGRSTISHNKIFRNKSGGIQVVPVDKRKRKPPSVVEFNEIFDNRGPSIIREMMGKAIPSHTSVPVTECSMEQCLKYKREKEHYIMALSHDNKCYNNEDVFIPTVQKDSEMDSDFCSNCRKKCSSRCPKCFTTTYCDKNCQKQHWRKHQKECLSILQRSTVTVKYLPQDGLINLEHGMFVSYSISEKQPKLAPKGPIYIPPKIGERFLVKILAADEEWHSNSDGPLLTICDRSLTVNGVIDKSINSNLHKIVHEFGVNSTVVEGWKKKFFWAQFHDKDHNTLDVFTTKFP